VRLLRAVRMAAKLGLAIDPAARTPIREMAELLENVPPARLFDEMLKLLLSGHAVECLQAAARGGPAPRPAAAARRHHGAAARRALRLALARQHRRAGQRRQATSPGFLFATLLWHEVLAAWEARKQSGELPFPALHAAMDEVLDLQAGKLAITRRIAADIKDIWVLQPRLENRAGRRPLRVIEQPRFRAGYDFLLLRAESGEVEPELADWWTRFIDADGDSRLAMLTPEKKSARRRRRRGKGKGDGGCRGASRDARAYVALGSNLGDPLATVRSAFDALRGLPENGWSPPPRSIAARRSA
jgi:poly(A) polymerase